MCPVAEGFALKRGLRIFRIHTSLIGTRKMFMEEWTQSQRFKTRKELLI